MIRPNHSLLLTVAFVAALQLQSEISSAQSQASVTNDQSITVAPSNYVILSDGRVIYKTVDQMPTYKGDLNAFLINNLTYPTEARKQKTEGKSVVQFIVNSDGNVTDAGILKSSGNEQLDQEALRVAKLINGWQPGVEKGNEVAVYFTLPVNFRLK